MTEIVGTVTLDLHLKTWTRSAAVKQDAVCSSTVSDDLGGVHAVDFYKYK